MRSIRPVHLALAAAVCAGPALAQGADANANAAAAGRHAAALHVEPARVVARYRLNPPRDASLPTEVTVADSAGTLVASYTFPGERAPRRMFVAVIDADLVLQDQTPAGTLTLQLFRQNGADPSADLAGRWWLDARQGDLRGRVQSAVASR